MTLNNKDFTIVDIDLENDDGVESRNSSRNSLNDEILSHYSYTDSDLHDFQKMEKDIYGSQGDDESSQEHDIMQEFLEDVTDEQTESLELVRPHVPVRPSFGNPIDAYDKLQMNYENMNHTKTENVPVSNNRYTKYKQNGKMNPSVTSPLQKSRDSSRASGGSAETVLSQSQQIDEITPIIENLNKISKPRDMLNSISSAESTEKLSTKRTTNRATLKTLLDKEKATRKSQETYIEHLQQSLNQILSQHALAKETIDQLRLGISLNIEETSSRSKLRRPRYQKQPSTNGNNQDLSRRYSSITGSVDIPEYMGTSNSLSRAKSVDMNIFDEEPNDEINDQNSPNNDYGGSLKYVKNESPTNHRFSREIANDFQLNFDKFQTRVEIIEQAIEELSIYIDGGASGSSGSQYGDLDGSSDRHQKDTENRLQNIILAYDNLQKDFSQVCQVWKDTAKKYMPPNKAMASMDSTEQIEGSLFQLRMQLDDLERQVNQSRHIQPLLINHDNRSSMNNLNRDQDLDKRLAILEDNYRKLIERYNDLKRAPSPTRQKDMEDIVQQLQKIVVEANGRSKEIASPENFETMLHQDLIDSMKRHLSSDSSPYFLTEDGLSSANSSFGKGRSKRKKGQRVEVNSNWKNHLDERVSPAKLRMSPRSPDSKGKGSPCNQIPKYDSQPVSLVSSNSGWRGATSGETLLVDDRELLRQPFRQGSRSTNDMFISNSNKIDIPIPKSRSFTNSIDLDRSRSRPNSSGLRNLDDDVKRLDEHLAKIELEEKSTQRDHLNNRDSDAAGSRNTRSLLETSLSNSNYSRQSKPFSSAGSDHRPGKARQSKQGDGYGNKKLKQRAYNPALESTNSGEESSSYEDDLEDYVRNASCGIGPRSRYVRKKSNVQDRWSQTPLRSFHKSPRSGTYDQVGPSVYDDPYIDEVAYWDGVAFHPNREGLPGKSILRQSPPQSKPHRKHFHKTPISLRQYRDSFSRPSFPVPSRIPYNESNSLRQYSTLGPNRYFVREYGQLNRIPPNHLPVYEDYEDEGGDDDIYPYRKYIEERRLCNYLDEAIKVAKDIKQYSRRLNNICEQRHLSRNYNASYQDRGFRSLYT